MATPGRKDGILRLAEADSPGGKSSPALDVIIRESTGADNL